MYALGIPNRQYRRCTSVLGSEMADPINYQAEKQDDGFYLFVFPEADEYDFQNIVKILKNNGVTTIGADSQLTEKNIMKLTNLLKEQPSPDENNLLDILKQALERMEDPKYRGGIDGCPKADHFREDIADIIEDYEEEESMRGITVDAPRESSLNESRNIRLQQLAGLKPLYEQGFDDRLAQAMGMSGDEFEDEIASRDIGSPFPGTDSKSSEGKALADRTIEHFRREHYRNMSDQDLDDFSAEMIEHFLDNTAAQARAKIVLARKGI